MDIRKKISLIFILTMLVMAVLSFTTVFADPSTCNVEMTVKMGDQVLQNKKIYHVDGTETVTVHVDRHTEAIGKIGYYYQYADGTKSEIRTASTNSVNASFNILGKAPTGDYVILYVEAVQVNATDMNTVDTVNKTDWYDYRYKLVFDKEAPAVTPTAAPTKTPTKTPTKVPTSVPTTAPTTAPTFNPDIVVKIGDKEIKANTKTNVEPGTIIMAVATPADKVSKLVLKWETDPEVVYYNVNARSAKIPDAAKPGEGYVLYVTAYYEGGKVVGPEKYIFEIPYNTPTATPTAKPTTKPTSVPTSVPTTPATKKGDIVVTYLDKVLEDGSTTNVKAGAEMLVSTVPADKLTKLTCRWGTEDPRVTSNPTLRVKIPDNAQPGAVFILACDAEFNGYTKAGTEIYKFKVVGDSATPVNNTLDIEPWMEENDDIEELSISLRNDSEVEDKANKNIYALGEVVTYYIDYKNGGKDINTECSIKLKLPLDFSVVNVNGGKVDGDTIVWKFPNGLKEDEAGTIVAKIKYTSLKRSKDYANTIYPSASILKETKVKDVSTVINFIITEYGEKLKVEHDPYMYGDADADTFRPDYLITRAEGALVLARIYGLEDEYRRLTPSQITTKYTDIDDTYFEAQQAITAASRAGLLNGYLEDDGTYTFRPNSKMTKAEFIKILACMIEGNAEEEGIDGLEIKELENLVKKYADTKSFYIVEGKKVYTHWAIEEITLMARLNMLPFLTEDHNTFTLDEGISRAEVAQLVNAYLLRAPADVTSKTDIGFSDVSRRHKLIGDIVEATRETHFIEINEEDGTEIAR